jgi:muramoyltetrapeptide carboxypeptidase
VNVVGGNLTAMLPLVGSPFARVLRPNARWLAIEDVRELPERIDRMLAHFTLAGWLKRYDGILLGTFHHPKGDFTQAALACLDRQIGPKGPPVVITENVGHVWPIAPLPIGRRFELRPPPDAADPHHLEAVIPWRRLRIV